MQNKQILTSLKKGESLTPLDMLYRFGCFRASARIYDLKRQGHNIKTKLVEKSGRRVAEYSLQD